MARGVVMRWISSLFLVSLAFASASGASDTEFCEGRMPGRLPATLEKISSEPANRLAFDNAGGLLNGGVCWWHSRFQRAAWYLARFEPGLPAPTASEANRIIRTLVSRLEVVVIPGFRDLYSFSKVYEAEIQRAMNAWQIYDSVVNQAYIRGLSGQARFRHAGAMRARMDRVFAQFELAKEKGDVLFLMLQMPGIVSHASLLQSMSSTPDGGYRLAMVDSNFPERSIEYVYRPGDLELTPANVDLDDYTSVPYAGFSRDLGRIRHAITTYCRGGV